MAKVLHTCSGCVPIDVSIIDVYTQMIRASASAEAAAKKADEASLGKAPYVGENGDWWEWDEEQKTFVDTGIQAETGMVVDDEMSDTSTYPVQNKVVKEYIDEHTSSDPDAVKYTEQSLTSEQKAQARTNIGAGTSSFSGSYNDLSNKPTIPTVPAISTNVETDKNSDTKTASPKAVHDITGSLADLNTTAKGTLVAAINEAAQSGGGSDPEAVKYTAQSLEDSQKTQARTNIGAGTYSKPSGGIPASDLASGVVPDVSGFYTKPASGIPASDIANGVIPSVPTISTDISSDAASDVKTASPKAVKNYVDSGIAAVESDISSLAAEVETIDIGAYVVAWDGNSEPVVANIPAGVSVTYNTTTYTGTLAASASTIQKIYLVATGTTDNYDRYITVGDSTYSWVNIGTTEISLARISSHDYAFAEVNGLWPRPLQYIQDGLVFFLDGKDFVSGQAWVDKIGNVAFTMTDCTKDGNGVRFNGASSHGNRNATLDFPNQSYTIEMVVKAEKTVNEAADSQVVFNSGLSGGFTVGYGYSNILPGRVFTNQCDTRETNITYPAPVAGTHRYSVNKNVSVLNSEKLTSNANALGNWGVADGATIGSNYSGTNWFFKGVIYAIRVYNRLLTEAEMKENQFFDVINYNL